MFVRMVIAEAVTDGAMASLRHLAESRFYPHLPSGMTDYRVMSEEDGRMVVMETTFETREASLAYHSSREYRQFVAGVQHLLVGSFVVKLFRATVETAETVR